MLYQNILLIDDDEDDQEIFLSALENAADSVKCVAFSNAVQAFEKLQKNELDTDIIFLDLNMPLMNGQEFLTQLKKQQDLKDIPVIILSTSSNQNTIQQAKKLGAVDFITKPHSFDDLVQILRRVLV
ncbi:response regulator [Dyadobacter sp. Leaf189]|uniref:response regulator n=1 Tax=Dyadobacter sp. Leaf189 TaxID=1736295 RepID=UPI0006FF3885|nr:response regulator [Dyadobacter sp. Leaf189]KQS26813.1 response regulator receiver protein [Dyadobacter sp. Leaf189]